MVTLKDEEIEKALEWGENIFKRKIFRPHDQIRSILFGLFSPYDHIRQHVYRLINRIFGPPKIYQHLTRFIPKRVE